MNKEWFKANAWRLGLAGGLLLLFIITLYFIGHSSLSGSKSPVKDPAPLGQINLMSNDGKLVASVREEKTNVGIANRSQEPLMDKVAAEDDSQTRKNLPDPLPWFYFSPQVALDSPKSLLNRERLVERMSLNDFAYYQVKDQMLLYQGGKPFTGFYNTDFDGWHYYKEGVQEAYRLSSVDSQRLMQERKIMADLTPLIRRNYFFVKAPGANAYLMDSKRVSDQILYKNTQQVILSAPPGAQNSYILATTENFYDIPMEVVEEVQTYRGTWLHVYIGYDELGWIAKDTTRTDYVPTYYSERELLDEIEYAVMDELQYVDARIGVSFINNETMSQISVQDQSFFPASTQKIYVLGELYHQYKKGILDPYESYVTLYDEDKVPGAGIIQSYPAGSTFAVDELVDLVGIYSDNTAANLLIDTVGGGDTINPHMQNLGLVGTSLYGKYYGGENTYFATTPSDAAKYFALLYNNRVNGEPWDEQLIEKFYLNSHTFLRTLIGGDTRSWNKSGLGSTEQNDVATFVTPYGSYSLAIYTAEPANRDYVAQQIGEISLRVHDIFNELRSQLWITVEDESNSEYVGEEPSAEEVTDSLEDNEATIFDEETE